MLSKSLSMEVSEHICLFTNYYYSSVKALNNMLQVKGKPACFYYSLKKSKTTQVLMQKNKLVLGLEKTDENLFKNPVKCAVMARKLSLS